MARHGSFAEGGVPSQSGRVRFNRPLSRAIDTLRTLVPRHVAATLRAYLFALICAGAGLAVTALTEGPFAGPFFMFQFAAVVGAALYGGLGPGF